MIINFFLQRQDRQREKFENVCLQKSFVLCKQMAGLGQMRDILRIGFGCGWLADVTCIMYGLCIIIIIAEVNSHSSSFKHNVKFIK